MSTENSHQVVELYPDELASVHQLFFGVDTDNIPRSPREAPSVLDFGKFWHSVIPSKYSRGNLGDKEIVLGFDFDRPTGQIVLSFENEGTRSGVTGDTKQHLIYLHTEPQPTERELQMVSLPFVARKASTQFAWNIPSGHFDDMAGLVVKGREYCYVAIGTNPENNCSVLVLMKTWKTQPTAAVEMILNDYRRAIHLSLGLSNPLKAILSADRILRDKIGLAVYRGTTPIPPQGDAFLRLRQ